ncbi:MAG TPA: hypothetical protein VE735_05970 [Gammaproteobacteria bacterium]|nr:hypothetical protein [Gammaproteobacteria bacterium]
MATKQVAQALQLIGRRRKDRRAHRTVSSSIQPDRFPGTLIIERSFDTLHQAAD